MSVLHGATMHEAGSFSDTILMQNAESLSDSTYLYGLRYDIYNTGDTLDIADILNHQSAISPRIFTKFPVLKVGRFSNSMPIFLLRLAPFFEEISARFLLRCTTIGEHVSEHIPTNKTCNQHLQKNNETCFLFI